MSDIAAIPIEDVIDVDVANDPYSAANTAVPAEFAGFVAVERFISHVGCNKISLNRGFAPRHVHGNNFFLPELLRVFRLNICTIGGREVPVFTASRGNCCG
jgi:hypothetical protein